MCKQPNILFYCTDQQRADLMGCMGHPIIQTPNFDRLAARGMNVRNCFVQGTVCMPSRASILTGLYPSRHGVIENGFNLDESLPTLPGILAEAGYHTGAVGRTHVRCSQPHPIHPSKDYYGFQDCIHTQCYWEGLDPKGAYLDWIRAEHPQWYEAAATPCPVNRTDAFCASWSELPQELSMTSWVTDQSLHWLDRHQSQHGATPFMLWAGTWDPHFRFLVSAPWDRMYDPASIPLPAWCDGEFKDMPPFYQHIARTMPEGASRAEWDRTIQNSLSIYYGMISHIDDQFGRLLDGLEERGELDDTIVVFTSDHGEMAGAHQMWSKGAYFYDDALRIPLLISAPGVTPQGAVSDAFVEEVDFLPTLLDLAGVECPKHVQGKSFYALLNGESTTHREDVFSEYQFINNPDYQNIIESSEQFASIRNMQHRLTVCLGHEGGQLFDYDLDPDCLHNRWNDATYADVRASMERRLLFRMMENTQRSPVFREACW